MIVEIFLALVALVFTCAAFASFGLPWWLPIVILLGVVVVSAIGWVLLNILTGG